MHVDEVDTGVDLVRRLLAAQFPEWSALPIQPVPSAGTDNALYRIGDGMVMRLPRIQRAVGEVDKDLRWLPLLAPLLPVELPLPLAKGLPAEGYPWEGGASRRSSLAPVWAWAIRPATSSPGGTSSRPTQERSFTTSLASMTRRGPEVAAGPSLSPSSNPRTPGTRPRSWQTMPATSSAKSWPSARVEATGTRCPDGPWTATCLSEARSRPARGGPMRPAGRPPSPSR